MKFHFCILYCILLCAGALRLNAQCTTATINWDNLDYLQTNTTSYSSFITTTQFATMVQNQNFTLGTNRLTIAATGYAAANIIGENGTHTGSLNSNGSGDDVEFKGNGTLTFTVAAAVSNLNFSLYDIDYNQKVTVTALNGATPMNVTLSKVSGTVLTINSTVATAPTATAGATTAVATSSADGTVNVSIAGPVTSVQIAISQTGIKNTGPASGQEDGSFWLSDISACVTNRFPTNYYNISRPFTGQPAYVLSVSDRNTIYMVDPATGKATSLFTDPDMREINNVAYDPYNKIIYYSPEGVERLTPQQSPSTVKSIKKYDVTNETIGTLTSNVNSIPYNIPTYESGLESGGASFYNGSLYIGVEGYAIGSSTSTGRESTVWRIDFDNTNMPLYAAQAYATPVDNTLRKIHDWGDFVMKDSILVDFSSSPADSLFTQYNLQTGNKTTYTPATRWDKPKQTAITWANQIVWLGDSVGLYNGTNAITAKHKITDATGSAVTWIPASGDGGEAFRPKVDFGDAPLSYDPDTSLAPAVHELNPNLKFGFNEYKEWNRGIAVDTATDDDGLAYATILNLKSGNYQTDVKVYNNTGAYARVGAWVDFNGNGTFEPFEGLIVDSIPSSTSMQTVSLYWRGLSAYNLPANSYTYLRIRVTSVANGMTTSSATGYLPDGEVEDWHVMVNISVLALQKIDFSAVKSDGKVKLKWAVNEETGVAAYNVLRSADGVNWQTIKVVHATNAKTYSTIDATPLAGTGYYRIYVAGQDGKGIYSETKMVSFDVLRLSLSLSPNPATSNASVTVIAPSNNAKAVIGLLSSSGSQLFQKLIVLKQGTNILNLPVSQLPNGQYIVTLQQGALLEQKKLVIIK